MSLTFYFIMGIPGMFVRGVANSLLPACLSLVPLTVFLVRKGAVNPEKIARHLFGLIFGMSLTYFIFLYITAGSSMDVVQMFSNRWMSLAVAFLFFVLALSELNVSFSIAGLVRNAAAKIRLDGFFKMMLAGVFVGIVGLPSVSPVMRNVIFEYSQFLRDILSSDYFREADIPEVICLVK